MVTNTRTKWPAPKGPLARVAALGLVLAAVALACEAPASTADPGATSETGVAVEQPGESGALGAGPTPGPAPANCRQRIEAAQLDSPESLTAVEPCRFTAGGTAAARSVLEAGGSDDAVWAAIWVYATGGSDPVPLRPYIESESTTIRVLSAAGLVAFGDATGLPILAASATDTALLGGSHPPISIRELVIGTFHRYVTADGAPARWTTPEEYLTVGPRWAEWATANASRVVYDTETGTWVLP